MRKDTCAPIDGSDVMCRRVNPAAGKENGELSSGKTVAALDYPRRQRGRGTDLWTSCSLVLPTREMISNLEVSYICDG